MSLRWKLVLPVAACALVLLAYLAFGWVPGAAAGDARGGVLLVVTIGMIVLLGIVNKAINTFVRRPLDTILHTYGDSADQRPPGGGRDASADEIGALRRTFDRLHSRIDLLDTALEADADRRKQLEVALRSSEERYVLAMRISDDGPWEWNVQTGEFVASPRWKSMLGYSDDELPNTLQAWRDHVHPLDIASLEVALRLHLDGQTSRFEHQFRLLHKDGRYRWVSSLGSVIRHASGKALRIVALDTDVTRVKRIENILQNIVKGTTGTGGDAFFRALVRNFAAALDVPCAFISECTGWPPTNVHTLAFWLRNDFRENIEFELAGTPCEAVFNERRAVFHPARVGQLFPRDSAFESYYGIPIFGSRGEIIGHMAFFNDKEMKQEDVLMDAVYQIFTARAAAEIERKAVLDRLTRVDNPQLGSPGESIGTQVTSHL